MGALLPAAVSLAALTGALVAHIPATPTEATPTSFLAAVDADRVRTVPALEVFADASRHLTAATAVSVSHLTGPITAASVAGSAVGPATLAISHDLSHSYALALWALAGAAALAAVAAFTHDPQLSRHVMVR